MRLLLAGVGEKFVGANHLAMQGAGDERVALDFAGFGVGDGYAIDFESAPHGALVVGFGFLEIGQSA